MHGKLLWVEIEMNARPFAIPINSRSKIPVSFWGAQLPWAKSGFHNQHNQISANNQPKTNNQCRGFGKSSPRDRETFAIVRRD